MTATTHAAPQELTDSDWDVDTLYEQNAIARERIRSIEYRAVVVTRERERAGAWSESTQIARVRRQAPYFFAAVERDNKLPRQVPDSLRQPMDSVGTSRQTHWVLIGEEYSLFWNDADDIATQVDHLHPDQISETRRAFLMALAPQDLLLFGFGSGRSTLQHDREVLGSRVTWSVAVEEDTGLMRVEATLSNGTVERRVWIDPAMGFLCVKHETYTRGGVLRRQTRVEGTRFLDGAVVVPTRIIQTTHSAAAPGSRAESGPASVNDVITVREISIEVKAVNVDYGPAGFKGDLLELPESVPVVRSTTDGRTEVERAVAGEILPWHEATKLIGSGETWEPRSTTRRLSELPHGRVSSQVAEAVPAATPIDRRIWLVGIGVTVACVMGGLLLWKKTIRGAAV